MPVFRTALGFVVHLTGQGSQRSANRLVERADPVLQEHPHSRERLREAVEKADGSGRLQTTVPISFSKVLTRPAPFHGPPGA